MTNNKKPSTGYFNAFLKFISIAAFGLFTSCNLPQGRAAPPVVVKGGGDISTTHAEFTLAKTSGFVIYYKILPSSSSAGDKGFSTSSSGEWVFTFAGRNFFKAYAKNAPYASKLWTPPSGFTNYPIHVSVTYRYGGSIPPKVVVKDSLGVDISSGGFDLIRTNLLEFFPSLKATDPTDMAYFNSHQGGSFAEISYAAMNFQVNEKSGKEIASVPAFIGFTTHIVVVH